MSVSRFDTVQTRYFQRIQRAARDFGDHEGISISKVTHWMSQFEDNDLLLAEKILNEIKYYSASKIRAMVGELVKLVYLKFNTIQRERILFIPIGEPYEGSSTIARVLREEVGEDVIKYMSDLERLEEGTYEALIFIDDFSGTGTQLSEWWVNVESIVLPRNVPFVLALLVINYRARPILEDFSEVVCVDQLQREDNVLSRYSRIFSDEEKRRMIHYCKLTNCHPDLIYGFDDCGLLLVFKHGCPDNSIPILWHTNASWEGLFKKSAI